MLGLLKKLVMIGIVGGIIFVGVGDSFLPKPLSTYSRNTREIINEKMIGLVHNPKLKSPSAEREKQIENFK